MDRKATEPVKVGGKYSEGLEDGPDSGRAKGVCMSQESTGDHYSAK